MLLKGIWVMKGDCLLGGGPMRHIFNLLLDLPDACSHMTFHQLLMLATLLTLLVSVILMISGRKLA